MHDLTKTFGRRVRGRRAILGWNQGALAMRANISRAQIARIERGQSSPKLDTVQQIAEALDVDVAALLEPID